MKIRQVLPIGPIALLVLSTSGATFAQEANGGQELQPSSLVPCPFTQPEIQDAFGVTVEPGQASDMSFPGGRATACLYDIVNSQAVITVTQTWGELPGPAATNGVPETANERIERSIPGDADGAQWVRQKKDAAGDKDDDKNDKKVKLEYKRAQSRVTTQLSYYGAGGEWVAADIRPKLLKLRRVP